MVVGLRLFCVIMLGMGLRLTVLSEGGVTGVFVALLVWQNCRSLDGTQRRLCDDLVTIIMLMYTKP